MSCIKNKCELWSLAISQYLRQGQVARVRGGFIFISHEQQTVARPGRWRRQGECCGRLYEMLATRAASSVFSEHLLYNVQMYTLFFLYFIMTKPFQVYNIASTFNRSCLIVLGNDYIVYSFPIVFKDIVTSLINVNLIFTRSIVRPLFRINSC